MGSSCVSHDSIRIGKNKGIRYIGGCCGFEPYHIRGVAEELSEERGRRPAGGAKWIPGFFHIIFFPSVGNI